MSSLQSSFAGEFQSSLYNREIVPYFQPLVHIRTGVLSGFEVLARWEHPHRGLISPQQFIPFAEQSGLIGKLTETILSQAFSTSVVFPANLSISVNISPTQLLNRELPETIRRVAEDAGFPLDRLIVEITETALVDDLERAYSVSTRLKDLGIKLALDDFGTGYSSLCHLQALPFDELKVDRQFVNSMLTSRESRKIVAAVIGLGQSLKLATVAEGIETEKQAEILGWLGCELGQGWLYGPAVSAVDLEKTIAGFAPQNPSAIQWTAGPERHIEPHATHRLAQYEAIYDGAPVGLSLLNTNLEYVNLNQRLADINGVPLSAHIGRKLYEIIPRDLYVEQEPWILRALKGEALSNIEVSGHPNEHGEVMTFLISYQPVFDEAGEILGLSVAIMDITERKRMEEALRASSEHHRNLVHLSPGISWHMEPDGKSHEVSVTWNTLTGQTDEQMADFGWLEALHPGDRSHVASVFRRSLRSGEAIDVEYRLQTQAGEWRWMRSRGKPHHDARGRIVRWYGCVEDIDETKRLQASLGEALQLVNALEQKLQRRNAAEHTAAMLVADELICGTDRL